MQQAIAGLAAMPAAKRVRAEGMVSSALKLLEPHRTAELSGAERQRAAAEARAIVRGTDKVLEKMLDVRIITTQREGKIENHVNLRVANEFACTVHHERATVEGEDMIFCFIASCELEPVVVLVVVHGELGRLVKLTPAQFAMLETALEQFRVRFGLEGEVYSYTPLHTRTSCSWHSRHFHLKIRVPTEMYLRVFPAMQVLGANHACKRGVVERYKSLWEPLLYKFELKSQQPWEVMRESVLADLR